jgi:hypothetical protein
MLTIEYDSLNGIPVADGMAEMLVLDMFKRGFTHYKTGSENLILATRALIADGKLPHTEIQFLFKGEIIKPDKYGRSLEWPVGFCDCINDWLSRLLQPPGKEFPDIMDVIVSMPDDK